MAGALVEREPVVSRDDLVAALVPPPLFARVSFETYLPDPDQPTQQAAVEALRRFADTIEHPPEQGRWWKRRREPEAARGVYLDGGFGVGKTHLLASLWHAAPAPKAYATFVELTHLAGALGFAEAVDALSGYRLLAIDEFELDDPGDTVLVSTMLSRLSEAGVALAATSNTLPSALGQGRFASEDFAREIQGLAARFTSLRIDGPDFRHRNDAAMVEPMTPAQVAALGDAAPGAMVDDFDALVAHLMSLHPSRYAALVRGVTLQGLHGVRAAPDEASALRLVVLVDRLYDQQVPVAFDGEPLPQIFTDDMLAGGYRKKYLRATSRLLALARLAGERTVCGVEEQGQQR